MTATSHVSTLKLRMLTSAFSVQKHFLREVASGYPGVGTHWILRVTYALRRQGHSAAFSTEILGFFGGRRPGKEKTNITEETVLLSENLSWALGWIRISQGQSLGFGQSNVSDSGCSRICEESCFKKDVWGIQGMMSMMPVSCF